MTLQLDPPTILRCLVSTEMRLNRSFIDSLGLTAEELELKPLLDWIHPDDRSAFEELIATGVGSVQARHATKRAGDWVSLDWMVKPHGDEIFALGRPSHRRAESLGAAMSAASSSKSEALQAMALIVEASNPGTRCSILLLDRETNCFTIGAGPSLPEDYNQAMDGLLIGPTVGSCGTAAFWNVPMVVENIAEDPLWKAFRTTAAEAEVAACWSHPITASDGSVLGAVAIYADEPNLPNPNQMDGLAIAARMIGLALDRDRLEEQLRRASQLEAIGRLSSGIAHDFNNLLTVILGHVELMRRQAPSSPSPQALETISLAIDRASDITSQLMAFGREQPFRPERVELGAAVADLMPLLKSAVGDEISVTLVTEPSSSWVMMDCTQLSQILLNLVLNARDAMPDGGRLRIETRLANAVELARLVPDDPHGSFVQILVTDDGQGMSDETKRHLFEPFFSTKEGGQNSGLGLASVYGLTRQNGGYITLKSELGTGTSFSLYFPTSGATEVGGVGVASSESQLGSILFAEDNDAIREVMMRALVAEGYQVIGARNGAEALSHVRDGAKIDMLVTDIMMPDLGGGGLVQELRRVMPEVHVLLISGRPLSSHTSLDPELRDARFLAKPFRPEMLVQEVQRCLPARAPLGSLAKLKP
jgi:two-component system, cell cycle sensor histidine kinase and response regulator CckA